MTSRRSHLSPRSSDLHAISSFSRSSSHSDGEFSPTIITDRSRVSDDEVSSFYPTRLASTFPSCGYTADPALNDSLLQSSWHGMDASMLSATFNLCNVITGSGIIGLPFATRQCGLLIAVLLLFLMAGCTLYSLRLLITAAHKLHRKRAVDIEDVMEYCFGRTGYYLGLLSIFCLDLGVMVALLIVIGDTAPPVLSYYMQGSALTAFTGRNTVLTVIAFLFILPPSSLPSLDSLSFISMTSVASVVLLTTLVLVRSFSTNVHSTHPPSSSIQWIGSHPLQGFGSIAFVFVCHDVSLQLYQGLRIRSPVVWNRVSRASIGVAMLPVFVLSIVGYCCFLDLTSSNILNNFTVDDAAMNLARLILAASMAMTYPSNLFMCRHVLKKFISASADKTTSLHFPLTIGLFLFTLCVALLVTDLGSVQSLVGSVCAVSLTFLIPAACSIRVGQLQEHREIWSWNNIGGWIIAVLGIVIMVLSVLNQLSDWLTSSDAPMTAAAYS